MKLFASILFLLPLVSFSADKHTFGWKSAPAGKTIRKSMIHLKMDAPIKAQTDLSAGMPPVYDQGQLGSCTANAGMAAFEYEWKRQHGDFLGGSRLGLYQDELRHDGNYPQDAGSYTSTVVWVFQHKGIGLEKCWGYDITKLAKKAPACYTKEAKGFRLVEAYDVDGNDGKSIRLALSNGYPVMFGCYVYQGIDNLPSSNILPMPKKGERPIGGHELLIVGHDDNTGLYKLRNSWSEKYGEGGYLFAPKAYVENPRISEDFAVVKVTK